MFTGIIRTIVFVKTIEKIAAGIRLSFDYPLRSVVAGESIAVNGCCLTALNDGPVFQAELSSETLAKTNLGNLCVGDAINIEPALCLGEPLGGHWVSGHVDKVVPIQALNKEGEFHHLVVGCFSNEELAYLLPKGSITIEGISLTINEVSNGYCQMMIIPHTFTKTTLSKKKAGDLVNIEFDYLARVIHHQAHTLKRVHMEREAC